MRLPRDVGAQALVGHLAGLGHSVTRQSGSHVRLTTTRGGEHHVTIPNHNPLRLGTLNGILHDVADHAGLSREQIIQTLFG
jgi:predicted RNA binding protein YcfA (HicA-like mRNA interferase family)